ncbi:hypothetical protein HDV06_006137 [Boothiomyces sp. JEL0866]|nr:hypothetical protein HDV06_006137 [Boothiomyces sp. JEL0866]
MDENRKELKLVEQKLEPVEQEIKDLDRKIDDLDRKIEDLGERKLLLKKKQRKEGLSSDEEVDLEEFIEKIAGLKEKIAKLEKDKEDLKAVRREWLGIIKYGAKKDAEMKKEKYYEFRGKVIGSKAVKGIRKNLCRFAQTHCGYYHPINNTFSYEDDNLVVDIVFKTEQSALNFQTEFEFINTNISYSELEIESDVVPIDLIPISKRVLLRDYRSADFDSPEDSMFSQSEFTEYQPTDDIVRYQSLEKIEWLEFGSEGAHLISHKVCKKRKLLDLDISENNRLALSRQLHGYVDGLANGRRPTVKLNYVPSDEEFVDGRYRVVVGVEFLNQRVKAIVAPLLKDSSKQSDNPLMLECEVFVRNKEEFIEALMFKSEETQKLWEELEFR